MTTPIYPNPAITKINTPKFRVSGTSASMGAQENNEWTSQADWDAGTKYRVDTITSPGDIKLDAVYVLANLPQSANVGGYWKFEEASGTIFDETANNNDGSYNGALYQETGKVNFALGFDGTDDRVVVSDNPSLDITTAITIAGWVFPDTVSGPRIIMEKRSTNNNNQNYHLGIENGVVKFSYRGVTSFELYLTDFAVVSAGSWQHVAVTYTSGVPSSLKIYVDGTEHAGAWYGGTGGSDPLLSNNDNVTIGINNFNALEEFNGNMDELIIWDKALTSGEILDLLNLYYADGYNRLVFDSGFNSVEWGTYTLVGTKTDPGHELKVRCRSASTEAGLVSAAWSVKLDTDTGELDCSTNRWIEIELSLETDNDTTPSIQSFTINYRQIIGDTSELQISVLEDFSTIVLNKTGLESVSGATEYTLSDVEGALLVTGTKYFYRWRTRYISPDEASKWNRVASFYYDSSAQFDPDDLLTEYAPEMWALVNIDDNQDRYEIERYPYPYEITPIRKEDRNRGLNGNLLIRHIATKYQIDISFDLLGQNGYNELKRFFIPNTSFYLISFIDNCRNIWKIVYRSVFPLQAAGSGVQDSFSGKIRFKEV